MAREYKRITAEELRASRHKNVLINILLFVGFVLLLAASPVGAGLPLGWLYCIGVLPSIVFATGASTLTRDIWVEIERKKESAKRNNRPVLGEPPDRGCFERLMAELQAQGKSMIDRYLVGFDLETGDPLWVKDEDMCSHGCVFAKTGVGKTLFLEALMFQQMLRGRASGCTFIDAKRDSGTLAQIILMAQVTGRIEDLIVIDPFDPVHAYNFVLTEQRPDVKARKILRAGLPPTSDQSTTKHYDRLAADAVARMVRALETIGLSWSIHDVAVALSAFNVSYPHLKNMLHSIGAKQALVELGHLASSYRSAKGVIDSGKLTDNLRGIASELHAISGSSMGTIFCTNYTDLVLTDAMLQGKIIYFMLPRLEEAEGAARMVKLFREDLEVSIGEITSSRVHRLEDPHLVIVDEGSSTFGPTWANLFELARKGRFALFFGAQSTGGLTDASLGLSEAFFERVMANVNLKVMMRVGDNRTAREMAEWFGKVCTFKTSIGAGVSKNSSGRVLSGVIDAQARSGDGQSQSINVAEDSDHIVSPEELKHEMSSEKGLAWFDLGDGQIVKGRAFWFNAEIPDEWDGREFLVKTEIPESDGLGLSKWVDQQILLEEQEKPGSKPSPGESGTPPERRQSKSKAPERIPLPVEPNKELANPKTFRIDPAKSAQVHGAIRVLVPTNGLKPSQVNLGVQPTVAPSRKQFKARNRNLGFRPRTTTSHSR